MSSHLNQIRVACGGNNGGDHLDKGKAVSWRHRVMSYTWAHGVVIFGVDSSSHIQCFFAASENAMKIDLLSCLSCTSDA